MKIIIRDLIILFFLPLFSYSQDEVQIFDIPFKNALSIKAIHDNNGNTCFGFRLEKDYYFIIISNENKVIYRKKIHETSDVINYFCGTISNKDQFIFFNRLTTDKSKLIAHIIYKKEPLYEEVKYVKVLDRKKEKIIRYINTEKGFFILSATKKPEAVFLTKFSNEKDFEKKEFHPLMPKLYKHLNDKELAFISKNSIYFPLNAIFDGKVYNEGQKFIFTFKILVEF